MVLIRLELAFLFLGLLGDVSFSANFLKWHLMRSIMVHGPTIFQWLKQGYVGWFKIVGNVYVLVRV